MSTESDLLQQVLAAPEDDAPRRALGDLLQARRDPRGELIAVQLRIAELQQSQGSIMELARLTPRQRALLDRHGAVWSEPVRGLVSDARFHRGFVDEIAIRAADLLSRADEIYRVAPVLHLRVLEAAGAVRDLCAAPALARIVSLDFEAQGLGDDDARAIASSTQLRKLTWLDLSRNRVTEAGLEALFASSSLPRLRWLGFDGNVAGDPTEQPDGYDEEHIIGWHTTPAGRAMEARWGKKPWCHYCPESAMWYPPSRQAFLDVARAPEAA